MTERPCDPPVPERPRPWPDHAVLRWAVFAVVGIALSATADLVFDRDKMELYSTTNGDVLSIWRHAEQATFGRLFAWWVGPWIESDSPHYRPLASWFLYAQWLLFRRHAMAYCVVMWLLHAGNCVLILLLLYRLWSGTAVQRVLPGIAATAWFSIPCHTGDDQTAWGNRGIAWGIMPYWPSQTDLGSLLLSLAALLLFDHWIESRRNSHLGGAAGCYVAALLFKEHAVIVPLLALALALYRRLERGWVARSFAAGMAAALTLLVARRLFVPEAYSPRYKGAGHVIHKAFYYLLEPALVAVRTDAGWIVVSAALGATFLALLIYRPRWWPVAVTCGLLGVFLPPQLAIRKELAFLLVTIAPEGLLHLRLLMDFAALVLAWEQRRRAPTLPLLASLVAVHLPILHVTGPHYHYWPTAWWAMFDTTILLGLRGTVHAVQARARTGAKTATQAGG